MKLSDCHNCKSTDTWCEASMDAHDHPCCGDCRHDPISTATNVTTRREFTVRHADGEIAEDVWEAVEEADRDARLWNTVCDCGGPHSIYARTVTTTDWEPLDAVDNEGAERD